MTGVLMVLKYSFFIISWSSSEIERKFDEFIFSEKASKSRISFGLFSVSAIVSAYMRLWLFVFVTMLNDDAFVDGMLKRFKGKVEL